MLSVYNYYRAMSLYIHDSTHSLFSIKIHIIVLADKMSVSLTSIPFLLELLSEVNKNKGG